MAVQRSTRPLQLVTEAKVAVLLDAPAGRKLEASGVCAHDGAFYVIFDDLSGIARITDLSGPSDGNQFLDADGAGPQWRGVEEHTDQPVNHNLFGLLQGGGYSG